MSRVLVVHRDAAHAARVAARLVREGHLVQVATSGERAIDRFVRRPADLLVVDLDLEGRDGVSTAESMRWMPGGRTAKVILTAEADPPGESLASKGETARAVATLIVADDLEPLVAAARRILDVRGETGEPDRGARRGSSVVRADEAMPSIVEEARAADGPRPAREEDDQVRRRHLGDEDVHGASTRVLTPEQLLFEAERASQDIDWEEHTLPGEEGEDGEDDTPVQPELEAADSSHSKLDGELTPLPDPALVPDLDGHREGHHVVVVVDAILTDEAGGTMSGSFEQVFFGRVLHRLAEQRATGALACAHPPDGRGLTAGDRPMKVVFLRRGAPVHVRSNLAVETLGTLLGGAREAGPSDIEELGPMERGEALARQLRRKLFDLFGWERGTFRFSEAFPPPEDAFELELGLAEIVYRGVLEASPKERLVAQLAQRESRYLVPQARAMARFAQLSLPRPLKGALRKVDGRHRVAEIAEGVARESLAPLVHALECLDAIRYASSPVDLIDELPLGVSDPPRPPPTAPTRATPSEPEPSRVEPNGTLSEPDDAPSVWIESEPAAAASEPERPPRGAAPAATEASEEGSDSRPAARRPSTAPSEAPAAPQPESGDTGSGLRPRDPAALDERVDRLLRAERYFRRAQRALERRRPESAREAMASAVELCPEEGQFRAWLGWSVYAATPEDGRAEALALLSEAVSQAPDLAIAHLLHGRVLEADGQREAAREAFARACELDPDNDEARQALAAVG